MAEHAYITNDYLRNLPERPGVYYMLDQDRNIIYIGKAKRLKRRVTSYFRKGKHITKKIQKLVSQIRAIEFVETGSELEALLLEAQEIKRVLPLFNRQIRNYKHYPFLKISTGTDYPRAYVVRQIAADNGTYFGPFPNSRMIEHALHILNREFKLRICTDALGEGSHVTPCLFYDLNQCSAPCDPNLISKHAYHHNVEELVAFIEGKSSRLMDRLTLERDRLSESLQFEKAAEIHRRIIDVSNLTASQQILDKAVHEHHLVIKVPGKIDEDSTLLSVVSGRLIGRLHYSPLHTTDEQLHLFLAQAYEAYVLQKDTKAPIRKEEVDEMRIIAGWLKRNSEEGEWFEIMSSKEEFMDTVKAALYSNKCERTEKATPVTV